MGQEILRAEIISWVKTITLAVVVTAVCKYFFFSGLVVHGESMSPTFEDKDKVLVTKMTDIERLDQVVFHAPDSENNYIKRVIGLPGDTVEMKDDVLYINGKKVDEPYLDENKESVMVGQKLTGDFTLAEVTGHDTVPDGHLFVLGDNRAISKDSRIFGFIREDSVIGEVQLRFYPINSIETY
ncbi:signal peptidase I [Domibacillus epiphyticus]|uniref:Signal peptidase I n=1 Tax=Domibacillus epiphyticus TaxID=1714355 RepID=A0A1V2AA65_9BACI|nr:signal peptidase I [Domibacillus epiphyticus]OMP67889.1 signal peptidase I [Domibacillus epiphyticus]